MRKDNTPQLILYWDVVQRESLDRIFEERLHIFSNGQLSSQCVAINMGTRLKIRSKV